MGAAGLRRAPRRAARRGHLPPGESGAPRPGRDRPGRRGLPGHPDGHRLPHDDGERPRRPRVGRGRDRGGGGDAGTADVPAAAGCGRRARDGGAPRGHDRDRSRPHADPDAPRARGRRQVRGVLRSRSVLPHDRRSGDPVEHVPRVRGHVRVLPRGRADARVPPIHRARAPDRPGGAVHEGARALPRRRRRGAGVQRDPGARSRRHRTVDGRPSTSPGPSGAAQGVGFVPRRVPTPPRTRSQADGGRSVPQRRGQPRRERPRRRDGPKT